MDLKDKLAAVADMIINDVSVTDMAVEIGVSPRTINNYKKQVRANAMDDYPLLAAHIQKTRDLKNKRRKTVREDSRIHNVQVELSTTMNELLKTHTFSPAPKPAKKKKRSKKDAPVGIIQFSDVHFNELIDDIAGNKYDFGVASSRIQKLVERAKSNFIAQGITNIAVFFTGDMLNSDRRLDEITSAATNRSSAVFLGVDILQQALQDLLGSFDNITVASITGNESRVGQNNHWGDLLASDSYDLVIHNMLTRLFVNEKRIKFIPINDPMECVVKVLNTNILLVHGHGHRGLASTGKIESEVQKLKAVYASRRIHIDYVMCGHIHQAYVSDNFSRSSGMPGNNAYARKALNLSGKASQNIYVVHSDGSIDGTKVCLQEYDDFAGYTYDSSIETYNQRNKKKTVVIQAVLV